jgi:putative ABC transport system permease protein
VSTYALINALSQGLLFSIACIGLFIAFKIANFPDLTCEGSFPLGAAVVSVLITTNHDPFISTFIAFFAGCAAGSVSSILNVTLKIPTIIASILVMNALYSVNLILMDAPLISLSNVNTVLSWVEKIGEKSDILQFLSFPVVFFLLVILLKSVFDFFLTTDLGLAMRATGDNPKMARKNGINTGAMIILSLSLANGLVALCGALFAQYQHFADINMGSGVLVAGLAAVFGGEALEERFHARSSIWQSTLWVIAGSILYRMAIALAYAAGLSTDYFNLLTSLILAVTMLSPRMRKKMINIVTRDIRK